MTTAVTNGTIKTNGGHLPVAAPTAPLPAVVVSCRYFAWTAEDMQIAKNEKGKDLSDAEFSYFLKVALARGLNPLLNQIYAIRRYKSEKDERGNWRQVPTMTIQTAIEGFIIIAERTGKYEGCKTWTSGSGEALKAHAAVYKTGSRDTEVEIDWEEFKQTNKAGEAQGMWAKMPKWMLQKVALARALSRAFPEDLSGLNTTDEMPSVEPQREVVTGPAATLGDVELEDTYNQQMLPPVTTIEPLDNPWLYKIKRAGKEKYLFEIHNDKPAWFNGIRARYEQGKMIEAEYVNCAAALEQPHLKAYAEETVLMEIAKEGNDNGGDE